MGLHRLFLISRPLWLDLVSLLRLVAKDHLLLLLLRAHTGDFINVRATLGLN